jgi:hypothetical protein
MKDALGHGSNGHTQAMTDGHPKTAPVSTHPAWQHDAPQYHARVSAKNGRVLGSYGPHPDRDAVIKEAFEKHPRAKTVSSSRGVGMDIRWHNR